MLKPIPSKILRSTAEVDACTAVDTYQNQTYTHYTVCHVHVQPTNAVIKSVTNTDVQLHSVLFVDAKRSTPQLDWCSMFRSAQGIGGDVRVTIRGVTYTVANVDELRDDTDQLHHWEVGLV